MKSSDILRVCSRITLVINIILIIIVSIDATTGYDGSIMNALMILGFGIVGAILANAFFQCIADIVDNTYNSQKKMDSIIMRLQKEDDLVSAFTQFAGASSDDKRVYADNLLKRGLITRAQFENMIK